MVDDETLRELRDSIAGQSRLCAEIVQNHVDGNDPIPAKLLTVAHQQVMLQSTANMLLLKLLEELSGREPSPPSVSGPSPSPPESGG
jgi:hypothetical protein